MLIEITGARFTNKGAQLMLATVCDRLRQAMPDVRLTMPLDYDAYADRAPYGLHYTVRPPEYWTAPRRLGRDLLSNVAARTRLGEAFGLVHERDIDALIDISGYAFGDKWSLANPRLLAQRAAAFRRRGKPVVMLPQMLGPFTKPGQAEAFTELSEHVDLIYAREQESFDAARPLVAYPERLRVVPDITITTPAKAVQTPDHDYLCLVPNSKLLQANPQQQDWSGSYLERLANAAEQAIQRGLEVVIVQHEYKEADERLTRDLHKRIGVDRCTVFRNSDPQVLKGFLGGARLVVGSRFHSLVSTLSMGVPAIALGWAHKYDALMRDFGAPEAIHRAADPSDHLTGLIDDVLRQHEEMVRTIASQKSEMVVANQKMWTDVFTLLGIKIDEPTHDRSNGKLAVAVGN